MKIYKNKDMKNFNINYKVTPENPTYNDLSIKLRSYFTEEENNLILDVLQEQ